MAALIAFNPYAPDTFSDARVVAGDVEASAVDSAEQSSDGVGDVSDAPGVGESINAASDANANGDRSDEDDTYTQSDSTVTVPDIETETTENYREHIAGQVIVKVGEDADLEKLNKQLAALDCVAPQTVSADDLSLGWTSIVLAQGVDMEAAITELQASGAVEGVQPNYVYRLKDEPTDLQAAPLSLSPGPDPPTPVDDAPSYDMTGYFDFLDDGLARNQGMLPVVRAREAWELLFNGSWDSSNLDSTKRPAVAVLDTGCDAAHQDLSENIIDYYDAVNKVKPDSKADFKDVDTHGTHVCGIVSARANNNLGVAGVSFNAGLVPVCVFKKTASGTFADSLDILEGYNYIMAPEQAADNIRVVNMSLGSTTETADRDDRALLFVVDKAYRENGILTVIAAGNDARIMGGAYSDYPSDFAASAISVIDLFIGDVGIQGTGEGQVAEDAPGIRVSNYLAANPATIVMRLIRADYSNYNIGGTMNKQISALGNAVYSTVPRGRYDYKQGTSMAAPCVAGIAALASWANPDLSPDQVKSVLFSTAHDIIDSTQAKGNGPFDDTKVGFDNYTGFGSVDAGAAVASALANRSIKGATTTWVGGPPIQLVAQPAEGCSFVWSSKNGAVATVDGSGNVTGHKGGYAIIEATGTEAGEGSSETFVLKTIVQVYDAYATGFDSVEVGNTATIRAQSTPSTGVWEWASSNPSVADVDTLSGVVTGKSVGQTTLSATLSVNPAITVQKTISVKAATPKPTAKSEPTRTSSAQVQPTKDNPLVAKAKKKTITVKRSKVKRKNITIAKKKAFKVLNAVGPVTFSKKSGNPKLAVMENGKIVVKKGCKKGRYKLKVQVRATGDSVYKPAIANVTLVVRVK